MTVIEEIFALYQRRGSEAYFGESVSMTEHGLQAAYFAREAGAPPALVVAALLHDVGHLVEEVAKDLADWKTDAAHERVGGAWLARRFPAEVSEPVRLHVPAKRYLLATDADYLSMLSPASVVTLKLQGGPMSPGGSGALRGGAVPSGGGVDPTLRRSGQGPGSRNAAPRGLRADDRGVGARIAGRTG